MSFEDRVKAFSEKVRALLDEFELDGISGFILREDEQCTAAIVTNEIGPAAKHYMFGFAQYLSETDFCPGCGHPVEDGDHIQIVGMDTANDDDDDENEGGPLQ